MFRTVITTYCTCSQVSKSGYSSGCGILDYNTV